LKILLRLSRPLHLFFSALAYTLGAGIAHYLGLPYRAEAFWLGLGWIFLVQLTTSLLAEIFRPVNEPLTNNESLRERLVLRNSFLLVAGAALTSAAILTLLMLYANLLTPPTLLFLGIAFILSILYSVPPARLVYSGFGEFFLSILLANLPVSLAFLLQSGEYHRLLGFITFPLILLAFAWLLVLNFPTYAVDQKYERRTLLRRIGWERAVPLHHALILSTYIIFLLGPLVGIPFSLIWPAFLTLPFAILQIFLVRGLALGGRPNWILLTATSTAIFGLTVYFLSLTFWLR
jgi:1,4-dihydroxy-2-naphthoate octaprenyltransferase